MAVAALDLRGHPGAVRPENVDRRRHVAGKGHVGLDQVAALLREGVVHHERDALRPGVQRGGHRAHGVRLNGRELLAARSSSFQQYS